MSKEMEKAELIKIIQMMEERKRNYRICNFVPQRHQQIFIDNIQKQKEDGTPLYKWLLFQGGNGAGKTALALYTVALFALGDECLKLGLPYIGHKRSIFVGTKSGDNIKNTIMQYLLEDFSVIKIPDEYIDKKIIDNGIVKKIKLTTGTTINFFTYDQGYERLQGTNGDLYLLDEEPKDKMIFEEALARTRVPNTQLFLSMTPLSGYTPVYEYFYDRPTPAKYVQVVSSLENKFGDHSWADGLSEDDRRMRISGMFTKSEGLVYPCFDRMKHLVPFFNPRDLGREVEFYGAVDFGVSHPTAFLFIAVDGDGHIYVFDMIYQSNMLLKDLRDKIIEKKNKYGIEFKYIIADSAAKRERTEIKELGINTVGADKHSKGENDMSNRRTGIMKVNQLFNQDKIYISEELKDFVKEIENHYYKEGGKKDGEVDKIMDDRLDAFRYFIFNYKVPKTESQAEIRLKKIKGKKGNARYLLRNRNKR